MSNDGPVTSHYKVEGRPSSRKLDVIIYMKAEFFILFFPETLFVSVNVNCKMIQIINITTHPEIVFNCRLSSYLPEGPCLDLHFISSSLDLIPSL